MQCRFIIDGDLFAGLYVAQGDEENVIVENLHEGVGSTRVIDVMSAVSAATAIETPAPVDLTNSKHPPVCSTARLRVGDLLAGVLGDLVSSFERKSSEAALAVY